MTDTDDLPCRCGEDGHPGISCHGLAALIDGHHIMHTAPPCALPVPDQQETP